MDDGSPRRLPTGISGLDELLAGGLVRNDAYLIAGRPGAGKTTFGNQLAYHHARGGERVVFATVLAETHDRMLAHLRAYGFYDPPQVGDRLYYVSLYEPLSRDGLDSGLALVRQLVRDQRATLLVLDGAGVLAELAASELELRHFVYALQAQLGMLGCTTVLLLNHAGEAPHPLETYVDGIIMLENRVLGVRDLRALRVVKLRGSNHRSGWHDLAITDRGLEVYPRLESERPPPRPVAAGERGRLGFGVTGLDEMLHGGLPAGSATLLLGTPGAGKTLTGLHFLVAGARRDEPGLVATFHEAPAELAAKAAGVGLDLPGPLTAGLVRVLWQPAVEQSADAWAHQLLAQVAEQRPRRIVLESLVELERLLAHTPARLAPFLTALLGRLGATGATVLLSAEIGTVVGQEVRIPTLSAAIDNALLLRYVELRSQLHRLLSIIKLRDSAYDSAIREFRITEQGLAVAATFESAEAVLTGVARTLTPAGRGEAVGS
jgi:circadian clock protein KaiC